MLDESKMKVRLVKRSPNFNFELIKALILVYRDVNDKFKELVKYYKTHRLIKKTTIVAYIFAIFRDCTVYIIVFNIKSWMITID